jgi:hypothetical protein
VLRTAWRIDRYKGYAQPYAWRGFETRRCSTRTTQARGDVVVVRFADDFVVGFEHRQEAERFLEELREPTAG